MYSTFFLVTVGNRKALMSAFGTLSDTHEGRSLGGFKRSAQAAGPEISKTYENGPQNDPKIDPKASPKRPQVGPKLGPKRDLNPSAVSKKPHEATTQAIQYNLGTNLRAKILLYVKKSS